jgi:hypothetical protein
MLRLLGRALVTVRYLDYCNSWNRRLAKDGRIVGPQESQLVMNGVIGGNLLTRLEDFEGLRRGITF